MDNRPRIRYSHGRGQWFCWGWGVQGVGLTLESSFWRWSDALREHYGHLLPSKASRP
jgi:hypothetical protein